MSDISQTIERLEQWVDYWQPHYPPEFIVDLRVLIAAADVAQRVQQAMAVLKDAKRFDCLPFDGDGVQREECEHGNCVDADLVDRLLDIFGE